VEFSAATGLLSRDPEYDQPGFTPAAYKPLVVEHGQLIAIDAGGVLLHFGRVGLQEGFEAGAVRDKRNVRGLPRWRIKIDSARDREVALRHCRSLRLDPDSLREKKNICRHSFKNILFKPIVHSSVQCA
jgi:hypothetical protein